MSTEQVIKRTTQVAGLVLTVAYVALLVDVVLLDGRGCASLRTSTQAHLERRAGTSAAMRHVPAPAEVSALLAEARTICEEAART